MPPTHPQCTEETMLSEHCSVNLRSSTTATAPRPLHYLQAGRQSPRQKHSRALLQVLGLDQLLKLRLCLLPAAQCLQPGLQLLTQRTHELVAADVAVEDDEKSLLGGT